MCHDRFTIQINLFKYKRYKDGGCAYKNPGLSHLNVSNTAVTTVESHGPGNLTSDLPTALKE